MSSLFSSRSLRFWVLLVGTYAVLLVVLGFRVYEDAALPPWVLAERCPSCFQKDQFLPKMPAERRLVSFLYAPLIDRWKWVFLLHAGVSMILLAGLWRLAYLLIGSEGGAWIGVWLILPILYYHHWGSNELYYPQLQPSLIAKAFGSWVWVFLLEKKPLQAGVFALLSSAAQPSVGILTWGFSLPLLLYIPRQRVLSYLPFSFGILTHTLYVLKSNAVPESLRPLWEKVFIDFRMGMHFDPSRFRKSSHFLFAALWAVGLYGSYKQRHPLLGVFILYGIGIVAYVINFYTVRWSPLIYSQLPRSTVWLKPLGVFMALSWTGKWIRLPILSTSTAVAGGFLMIWSAFRLSRRTDQRDYIQVFHLEKSESYQLGSWIRQNLPDTILLAVPPTEEAVLFYAQRSGYLWPNAVLKHEDPLLYAQRVRQLYGKDPLKKGVTWEEVQTEGAEYYEKLCRERPDSLIAWGITHAVVPSGTCMRGVPLWKGERLALYEVGR